MEKLLSYSGRKHQRLRPPRLTLALVALISLHTALPAQWQPAPPICQPEKSLRCPQLMTVNWESLEKLGRFLQRGLRIGATTVLIVELLRNDWTGGISSGVAWLVLPEPED